MSMDGSHITARDAEKWEDVCKPKIPFGYTQVYGQLQKGDGVWNAEKQRFVKVKKAYPVIGLTRLIAIRKCVVTQQEFDRLAMNTEAALPLDE